MGRTLVLIKPDAVEKEVWLKIIKSYESLKFKINRTKIFAPMERALVLSLYSEHQGREFFHNLIEFMTKGVTIALEVHGYNPCFMIRELNGDTDPKKAKIGTIRDLYGTSGPANAVHCSANPKDAEREIRLIFGDESKESGEVK